MPPLFFPCFLYSLLQSISLLVYPLFIGQQKSRVLAWMGFLIHFHPCLSYTTERNACSSLNGCPSAQTSRHGQQGKRSGTMHCFPSVLCNLLELQFDKFLIKMPIVLESLDGFLFH